MQGLKNFLWFLYKCFAFYTVIVYALILWIPSDGWLAGFMMMSFPAVIIVHILSVLIWFVIDRKKALLPITLLALGGIFASRTFSINRKPNTSATADHSFSVLSYNTRVFMKNSDQREPTVKEDIASMKVWVRDLGADIICMPEYYEDETRLFNINETLRSGGYKYSVKYSEEIRKGRNYYTGLALFSKYPIINARDTIFQAQNGLVQADIEIKNDTVRMIGVHLYSMTLNLSKLAHEKEMEGIRAEGKTTFKRMKTGFMQRSKQLQVLESWIAESPYPVIICGDFNEVPYGYVYGRLRKSMRNGFEEKGEGFGFTFNHIPYFIRIDHQFYKSDQLNMLDFKTLNQVKYSDHYPIMGIYQIQKTNQ
ncbi:endonuclease/exonuclease/phosphatase family protein [Dyadobacter arcticus]|uniref:Endonuclease/exonuclease/phosphatase (EEP) superfamily protein YafD n=1 Tax=Dyadobacter arcticus TaxID=1078754 RepID=A0ABX0UPM5_9BACT|nr:endonuclease/exonuclease/phosphatase family protein [Dyadobacter arcticus]NIJ54948.1 endonuclease/exonuclease/phosphatase (EEP) superfamily protein YafD [Dyadobacter arcticus]